VTHIAGFQFSNITEKA